MNGEESDIKDIPEGDSLEEESSEVDPTETVVLAEVEEDDPGDLSAELNVEELLAKLEKTDSEDVHRKAEIRHRVEELREERDSELDSTYNINLDDDL